MECFLLTNIAPVKAVILQDNIPYNFIPFSFLQVTNFESWEEVKDWANSLFLYKEPLSKDLKEMVNRFKLDSRTSEEYLTKVTQFVQNKGT